MKAGVFRSGTGALPTPLELERPAQPGRRRWLMPKRPTKDWDALDKKAQGVVAKISTVYGIVKSENSEKKCTFSLDMALNQPIMWPEVGESG